MKQKGIIVTYVLVFCAVFLVLLGGLFSFILFQLKKNAQKIAWHESLEIAEAGLNYYRWCLNNRVEDICETEKEYLDLDGSQIGTLSLEISSELSCGETAKVNVQSIGWTNDFPDIKRKVASFYARPSVAQYVYLLNDSVWAGADREIRGLFHSNGGIRMDGENYSSVTSAMGTWLCGDSFGCYYPNCPNDCVQDQEEELCRCPGVFTTTGNPDTDLFEWPVSYFDFEKITIDLAQVKEIALPLPFEKYWPPVSDIDVNGKGYHFKLDRNDIQVWVITELSPTESYSYEDDWHDDYFIIDSEYLYKTISIDPECSLIFVEDNLWIDGKLSGKLTIISANLIDPTEKTSIILPSDIEYNLSDGSDALMLTAEKDVLISPIAPNSMELKGVFIAQTGHFGINHYPSNIKDKLELHGAIISYGRVGTKWSSGSHIVSGFRQRETYADPNLIYHCSPFVPVVGSEFEMLEWEEIE